MSESIFSEEPPVLPVVPPVSAPSLPQEVVEFVGAGKKYSSVEEALKSVPHAQKHILTLEQELANAKDELAKRKTTEELLEDIKSSVPTYTPPVQAEITQDKLNATVEEILNRKTAQQKAANNINIVTSTFSENYGDKAEEIFNTIAVESGLTVQQLNTLAASSPMAVLKLAGLEKKQESTPVKTNSSVNTQALRPTASTPTSARVPQGATTKDLVNAWRIAGEKVKQKQS